MGVVLLVLFEIAQNFLVLHGDAVKIAIVHVKTTLDYSLFSHAV